MRRTRDNYPTSMFDVRPKTISKKIEEYKTSYDELSKLENGPLKEKKISLLLLHFQQDIIHQIPDNCVDTTINYPSEIRQQQLTYCQYNIKLLSVHDNFSYFRLM